MKERMAVRLYDEEFVRMNNPPKEVEYTKHEQFEAILNDYVEVKSEGSKTFLKSGIIDGLKSIIDFATRDHERITRIRLTGKRSVDNIIKKDVADYYKRRIQNHASEIVSYLNGLIQRDDYPEEMFGNYKVIKQVLDLSEGQTKDKYLVDLYICAKTAIPPTVWESERVVVEPAITKTSNPPDA